MISEDFLWVGAASVRVYAALLMSWGAVSKLRHQQNFDSALYAYRLLPSLAVKPVGRMLPWLEAALAFLLLAPFPEAATAAMAAAGLLTLFGVAITVNMARGRRLLDCGCGGPSRPAGPGLITHNLLLAILLWLSTKAPEPSSVIFLLASAAAGTAFLLNLAQAEVEAVALRREA